MPAGLYLLDCTRSLPLGGEDLRWAAVDGGDSPPGAAALAVLALQVMRQGDSRGLGAGATLPGPPPGHWHVVANPTARARPVTLQADAEDSTTAPDTVVLTLAPGWVVAWSSDGPATRLTAAGERRVLWPPQGLTEPGS